MRNTFLAGLLLLTVFSLTVPVFGQTQAQDRMITVPESMLTAQQKAQVTAQDTVAQGRGWLGLGKELGEAVDASLGALTTRSEQFAQTSVGKFVMFIVAWKVLGQDAIQFIVGILLWPLGMSVLIWSYRRTCLPRQHLIKTEGIFKAKVYQIIEPHDPDGTRFVHAVLAVGLTAVTVLTIFA